ncbi:MAG: DNA-binding protein [Pedobacter sp.]|nr:MAG: DNA-binding protein [Pedobacter sp.]
MEKSIANLEKLIIKLFEKLENEDRYMDIKEAANYLGKGYSWLYANKHNIGCARIGGEWKFKKSQIDLH